MANDLNKAGHSGKLTVNGVPWTEFVKGIQVWAPSVEDDWLDMDGLHADEQADALTLAIQAMLLPPEVYAGRPLPCIDIDGTSMSKTDRDADYTAKVLGFVHQLRVDPHDEATRLVLADYLEEFGREGVQDRCCKWLRCGWIVPNSLDKKTVGNLLSLGTLRLNKLHTDVKDDEWTKLQAIRCLMTDLTRLEPADYRLLWDLAVEHRLRLENQDVWAEAEQVKQDRERLAEERTKPKAAPKGKLMERPKARIKLSELVSK